MIVELLVQVFTSFVTFVLGMLPTVTLPAWLGEDSYLSEVWSYGAGLGAWIPFALFGQVAAVVMSCVLIGFTIKIVRIVASFFTAGGGSAA